jgi:nucleotide-binding universal stress UspA family protein
MKTIIVPIDFSEYSLKGLEVALLFAKKLKANIEMVYVQKKTGEYYPSIKEQQLSWAEKQFVEIQKNYCHQIPKRNKFTYIIKHGKVHQEIVNQAQAHKDSMIVTSTHGVSGFDGFFMGSNATKIISLSEKPIITINTGDCPTAIKKIILPIDSTIESRQKVPFTIELAKIFKAEIHVVSVCSSKDEDVKKKVESYANQVCKLLKTSKIEYKTKAINGPKIADLILKYTASVNADLISIMSEQSAGLSSLLLGSVAETILLKSVIPVLITTPKDLTLVDLRIQGGSHS